VWFVEGTTTAEGERRPLMPGEEEELKVGQRPKEGRKGCLDFAGAD